MNIIDIKSPRYTMNGVIVVDIKWEGDSEYHSFAASPDDVMEYGRELYRDLSQGTYGEVAPYSDESARQDKLIASNMERSMLMAEADSIIRLLSEERDAGIISDEDEVKWKKWIMYRKILRALDLTSETVSWPEKP